MNMTLDKALAEIHGEMCGAEYPDAETFVSALRAAVNDVLNGAGKVYVASTIIAAAYIDGAHDMTPNLVDSVCRGYWRAHARPEPGEQWVKVEGARLAFWLEKKVALAMEFVDADGAQQHLRIRHTADDLVILEERTGGPE